MGGRDVDGHGMYTAGNVESRETDAHGVDAFSVACGLVLLTRDHEGIIVLEQLQPLTLWVVSIPISRQRRNIWLTSSSLGTLPSSSCRATAILAFSSFLFCSVLAILFYCLIYSQTCQV